MRQNNYSTLNNGRFSSPAHISKTSSLSFLCGIDIRAAFSLHRAAFLQKLIEKRISNLDSASQNWLRPPIVVQLAKILLFSVICVQNKYCLCKLYSVHNAYIFMYV